MTVRVSKFALSLAFAMMTLAPAATAQNKRILWDTHHGIYAAYSPSGSFSTMTSLLQTAGYDVVESSAGILSQNLSTFDVVVINALSAYSSAYTVAEAQAVHAFAVGGGGVLFVGDNASVWPANVAEVGKLFDITVGVKSVSPSDLYLTNLPAGEEMFQGITSIYFRAAGELQVGPNATALASTANGETMIARWNGGSVVAIGDGNAFDNSYIANADNVLWLPKLFDALSSGSPPTSAPARRARAASSRILTAGSGSCDGLLSLQLQDAVGGATSLLLAGTKSAQIPAVGGTVYVDAFTPPFLAVPLPLGGTPGVAGAGFAILGQNLQPYLPLTLTFQFAVYDPGAAYGVALSNGLEVPMGSEPGRRTNRPTGIGAGAKRSRIESIHPLLGIDPMSSRSGLLLLPVLVASLAFAPAASGQNKRILWDVHHGSFGPYTVAGNFSTMASLLKAAGYDVVESSAGVLSEDLSTYDAVIVPVLSAFASPYTAAEAQAIRSYANGGGGVLLVGDTQFAWPGNVNPVAQLFDITLGNPSVSSSDTWVTNLSASEEMFQGVTSIYFLAGGVLQVGPDAASVGSTAAGETMIARWNLGRVVALGDGNAFENAFIGSGDNIAYLTKLFDYLTDGCVSGLGDGSPGVGRTRSAPAGRPGELRRGAEPPASRRRGRGVVAPPRRNQGGADPDRRRRRPRRRVHAAVPRGADPARRRAGRGRRRVRAPRAGPGAVPPAHADPPVRRLRRRRAGRGRALERARGADGALRPRRIRGAILLAP